MGSGIVRGISVSGSFGFVIYILLMSAETYLRFPRSYPICSKVFRSMPSRVRSVVAGVILPGTDRRPGSSCPDSLGFPEHDNTFPPFIQYYFEIDGAPSPLSSYSR
eukprot:Gb_12940 [translate_table: standard]